MNTSSISTTSSGTTASIIASNKVIRNTYMLLSMTLLFSGVMAALSVAFNLPHPGLIITLVGYFGLLFATYKCQNSGWGLVSVFALTGFMGLTLGPIISSYLSLPNGGQVVAQAMISTAVIFVALSAYAITSKKDFSFMGGFLMVGILVAFLAGLGAVLFSIPALSLAVSGMFVLLMSGLILYETSNIMRGGETNYIMATTSLFVAIFNLFTSLLQLLGFFNGDD
ncbi:BAX inhibitor (BI)-1/YccA family protein [Corallincola holothuriorum]|uniref:BAX inhibitor (BI)-1/YccA family protein n=1 Tax=Corallincola holothuriorum TaxID=2282215 RepID=A0A368NM04_9GAMM|nr:Bax inhibitor-1/YccA family protein [Corallincola holothuriorum]RCU50865.1 BAX inhibitor (BI)-1/YccA family protein [Corallincola holothuriorum]